MRSWARYPSGTVVWSVRGPSARAGEAWASRELNTRASRATSDRTDIARGAPRTGRAGELGFTCSPPDLGGRMAVGADPELTQVMSYAQTANGADRTTASGGTSRRLPLCPASKGRGAARPRFNPPWHTR